MNFENLGLKKEILQAITDMGFKEPSPIQAEAIPVVLQGKDIIGQAHTGTGKTAAFGLPAINMLEDKKEIQVLVMAPTRELANQVSDQLFAFGKNSDVKTVTVLGGQSYKNQIERIKKGAQVVVATPGRLLDLLSGKKIGKFAPKMVILDEADEMLDMGFAEDIAEIFKYVPEDRQTLLFSATMSKRIRELSEKILKDPVSISVTDGEKKTVNENISERFCVIDERERDDAVVRIMDSQDPDKTVIFCRTKREVDRLATLLMGRGYLAKGLHGDMEQRQRESVVKSLKNGSVTVLVATDVAARGLDVKGISHVINFHMPFGPDSYVHRIGRTGRAGENGVAITLVTPREMRDLKRIKQNVGQRMEHLRLPTSGQVVENNFKKLVTEVRGQKVAGSAAEILADMMTDMSIDEVALKLISFNLEMEDIAGPEMIGLTGEKLKRFFENLDKADRGRKGGRGRDRGRRRRRNRDRGGSRGSGRSRGGNGGGNRGSRGDRRRGDSGGSRRRRSE